MKQIRNIAIIAHVDYWKTTLVDELYILGLTAEYCVKSTVLDVLKYGFKTFVIKDAVEGIRQNEDDFDNAFEEMKKAGATIITSDDING